MTPEQLGNLFLTAPIWEDPELEAEARDLGRRLVEGDVSASIRMEAKALSVRLANTIRSQMAQQKESEVSEQWQDVEDIVMTMVDGTSHSFNHKEGPIRFKVSQGMLVIERAHKLNEQRDGVSFSGEQRMQFMVNLSRVHTVMATKDREMFRVLS